MTNIATLILAAGSSSRLGEPKQLLLINNNYLLDVIINKTKLLPTKTYCVLGDNYKEIINKIKSENIFFLHNKRFNKGISESIKFGINAVLNHQDRVEAILLVLGDQPKISSDYLLNMIEIFKSNSSKIIASKYEDSFGIPALFPKGFFNALKNLKEDKGAKKVLNSNKKNIIVPKIKADFFDIDTQEDYKLFLLKN